jgi:CHAT domain-containing protein/tetratricopeptide (TPR) repeat protein
MWRWLKRQHAGIADARADQTQTTHTESPLPSGEPAESHVSSIPASNENPPPQLAADIQVTPPAINERETAIQTFMSAGDPKALFRALETYGRILIEDETLVRIQQLVAQRLEEAADSTAMAVKNDRLVIHLQMLEEAREMGIPAWLERMKGLSQTVEQLLRTVSAFVNASTWSETHRMLEEQSDVLLSDPALAAMRFLMMEAQTEGNERWLSELMRHMRLLEDARKHGVQSAWARFAAALSPHPAAPVSSEVAVLALELDRLQRPEDMPRRIELITRMLSQVDRATSPGIWAGLHNELARSYLETVEGNPIENQERALQALDAAVSVPIEESSTRNWIWMHMNRGGLYLKRVRGELAENIERAIQDYDAALTQLDPVANAYDWASTRMNRGNAYLTRVRGNVVHNLAQAIEDFSAAIESFSHQGHKDIAGAYMNRGNAYRRRAKGGMQEDLMRAIADYDAALAQLPGQTPSYVWASCHSNRGIAYADREGGDPAENVALALADFDAALTYFTLERTPIEWADVQLNRANTSLRRSAGNRELDLEQALIACDAALGVFTLEAHPRRYRDAQLIRADALMQLERWDEAHAALLAAREVTRTLIEGTASRSGISEVLQERSRAQLYIRDAQALLHLTPPDLVGAISALEEGRAQNLRMALNVDDLDPMKIQDPQGRARAESFLAAQVAWRVEQLKLNEPLANDLNEDQRNAERVRRHECLSAAYREFLRARDAIRLHDDPDFLAPLSTLAQIAQAVEGPQAALVYLVAGMREGYALVLTKDAEGTSHVTYISLPNLTQFALAKLTVTRAPASLPLPGLPAAFPWATGGFVPAQLGWAFSDIPIWGRSLQMAAANLPVDSGYRAAALMLSQHEPHAQTYPAEYDQPFSQLEDTMLNRLAGDFNRAVLSIELDRSLRALSTLGISDLAHALLNLGIEQISLVPYDRLALFPLPAVPVRRTDDAERTLGDLFEVRIVPSARAAAISHARAAQLDRLSRPLVVAAGNPQPLPLGAPSLPYAEAESATIARIARECGYPAAHVHHLLPSTITREQLLPALERAWYAHLAVHGEYVSDDPRQSRLILAGGSAVPEAQRSFHLGEALDGAIHLQGLRLLVLSACDTALIEARMIPDEVIGLAAGFLQAGAAGVVASLWAVDDRATYLLMSRFARLYLDQEYGLSPARALAEAQRWLREEATNQILATYDPLAQVFSLDVSASGAYGKSLASTQVPSTVDHASRLIRQRSLRWSHSGALAQIRAGAARQALDAPDALPYADPIYWAAFVVTGC